MSGRRANKPGPNSPRRDAGIVAQVAAITAIHEDEGGQCVECGTKFPCATRNVMLLAREYVWAGKSVDDAVEAALDALDELDESATLMDAQRYVNDTAGRL